MSTDRQADVDTTGSTTAPEGSFDAFYASNASAAMRLALLLTPSPDDAHDVVHDAFVGMLSRWEQIDDPSAYLRRSVANGAANTYRGRDGRRRREQRLRNQAATTAPPADEYLADQIEALPFPQRAVIVLKYFADLTEREIAEATGMRPGSVGPTLQRVLARLRKGDPS